MVYVSRYRYTLLAGDELAKRGHGKLPGTGTLAPVSECVC